MTDATTEEVPWKLPVAAAALGALLAAIYVIFTIVNAPTEPEVPVDDTAAESTAFPTGYVAVSSDVGMRVDVLRLDGRGTTAFISSVVRGGEAPGAIQPIEVAAWTVTSGGTEYSMLRQSMSAATPGAVTVALGPIPDAASTTLLTATLPGTVEGSDDVMILPAELPATVSGHRIEVGDDAVIVADLVIDDDGGWVRWNLEGGVAAKVEVVVSLDGLAFAASGGRESSVPVWGTAGETQLVTVGAAQPESDDPAEITIELYVSVVTEPGHSIEIPIRSVVGR
jgi:hypothetical protein